MGSRVRPGSLSGLARGKWRGVIVGAERNDVEAIRRFCALLVPRGLNPRALLPAYGLAEATLAVTGLPLAELYRSLEVDPAGLRVGGRAVGLDTSGETYPIEIGRAHV